jgi:hypothetical protein
VIRLSHRPVARMAAIAAILAGTGIVLSSAAPAAGRPVASPSLEYSCKAPGWQQIPVHVTVSIPEAATVGQPIRPTRPAITMSVPQADTRHLARMKSSTVTIAAQFRTDVAQNGRVLADPWLLSAASAPVPPAGSLMLHMRGTVQPVMVRTPGDITFTAVGLSLRLTPHTPGSSAPSPAANSPAATGPAAPSPAANSPASVHLDCTLDVGQSATLATVPVTVAIGHSAARPAKAGSLLWQAGPGGSFSGSAKRIALKDATTGTVIACKSSSISGTLKSGHELPAAGIGSIPSVTVQTCTGPGGRTFTVATSASASHPWLLNAQSFDTTSNVTTVTISGIMASVSGPGCSATVAGPSSTAPGTVEGTNSIDPFTAADTLSIGPGGGTLHLWNVSGCSGLFSSGDALSFTAPYTVTSSLGGGIYLVPPSCPPFPVKTGFPFNPHFKLPKPPPGSKITFPPPPLQGCAFIKGFSDVSKLGEAALIGPGFGNIQASKRLVTNLKANYFEIDSAGKLYFKPCPGSAPQCRAINGLPPVTATFLSFGFLPTTATLQITQVGTLDVVSVGTESTHVLKYSKILSLASIRVERVLANGVPLPVGSDCHTVKPFKLVLTGKPPYSLNTGGVIIGMIHVPPFTGCGVGENIDPIFNATVSGPGNFVKLTQGSLCVDWPVPPFPVGCPATVPKPVH